MKLTRKVNPIIEAFRKLPVPEDEPAITNLAGSFSAKMLLLAEHPTQEEYELNAPFCGVAARQYMAAMMAGTDLDVAKDFLIVPFSRFGKKPNKASTMDTFPFIHSILPLTQVKCVVCLGMAPFAFTFAGGRKTHARSITGNPMFLPQLHTKPVFVMPDTQFILPDLNNFKEVRFAKEKLIQIQNLTLNLLAFVKTLN